MVLKSVPRINTVQVLPVEIPACYVQFAIFFMSNSINYEVTSSCCKPSGEQDSNLLVTCGYLGVLLLCRHFNMILCLSEWFLAKMSNGVMIT